MQLASTNPRELLGFTLTLYRSEKRCRVSMPRLKGSRSFPARVQNRIELMFHLLREKSRIDQNGIDPHSWRKLSITFGGNIERSSLEPGRCRFQATRSRAPLGNFVEFFSQRDQNACRKLREICDLHFFAIIPPEFGSVHLFIRIEERSESRAGTGKFQGPAFA